jgi:C-terminal processing protease CtpA/Prc
LEQAAMVAGPDGGMVGYLRMFYFSSETTRAMVQALSSWEEAGLQGFR